MSTPPSSPADPRPNNEPYYIDADCPECGTALVLYDEHHETGSSDETVWHDEWVCPSCEDGLHVDWPDGMFARLTERMDADPEDCARLDEAVEQAANLEFAELDEIREAFEDL